MLLGLCRDPLVCGLLGVLVLHSSFLMGLVSTLATFGSMVGPFGGHRCLFLSMPLVHCGP